MLTKSGQQKVAPSAPRHFNYLKMSKRDAPDAAPDPKRPRPGAAVAELLGSGGESSDEDSDGGADVAEAAVPAVEV